MTANGSNTCAVLEMYNLSTYCLTANSSDSRCVPDIDAWLIEVAGVWCIINAVIGFTGNLLTLLAIPYASRHKRFLYFS
jgi:hypothetical protein